MPNDTLTRGQLYRLDHYLAASYSESETFTDDETEALITELISAMEEAGQ